jgi:hypothetical protein
MPLTAAARNAEGDRSAGRYQRHRPEQTLLYQLVEQHYPVFVDCMAGQGRPLPDYVQPGVRGLPSVRPAGARLFAGALR